MNASGALTPPPVSGAARPLSVAGVAFGRRFFVLLLAGFVWLIPAFGDLRFVWALVVWDGLVFVAWGADVLRLPAPAEIDVRRSWLAPPALSVESSVELTVTNRSAVALRTRVIDRAPTALRFEPPTLSIDIAPHADVSARYQIRPGARGAASVGAAYLRYQSAIGLAERWAAADISQPVLTCPNLEEAKRQAVALIRSRQIEMEKRTVRLRGQGRAFESLRDYRQGDELRDLCWTASARRGKLTTRTYEVERSQTIWLTIDAGRLMRARVGALSKLDVAVNAALALAQVAINSGDRVGMLAYGYRIAARLPAARGSAHLRLIVDRLARVREEEGEADHRHAASRLLTDQKPRCLVVWITDLAETTSVPDVVRAALQLAKRHVVLIAFIGDADLQGVAARIPQTIEEMYETAAAQEIALRREGLLAKLREGGALALETTASGLTPALVNGYLDIKQRGRI